jgi:ribonuclease P protein component
VTDHFVMLLSRRRDTDARARLGITASRKVGCAVRRNRIKRLVREAFRTCRDLWPPGTDVVVIVRKLDRPLTLLDVTSEWRGAKPRIRKKLSSNSAGSAVEGNQQEGNGG